MPRKMRYVDWILAALESGESLNVMTRDRNGVLQNVSQNVLWAQNNCSTDKKPEDCPDIATCQSDGLA